MPNKTFDLNSKSPKTSTKMGGDKLSIIIYYE